MGGAAVSGGENQNGPASAGRCESFPSWLPVSLSDTAARRCFVAAISCLAVPHAT